MRWLLICLMIIPHFVSMEAKGEESSFSFHTTEKNQNAIVQIQNRGYLLVAMHHDDFRPFFWVNKKGKLVGIEVELAELIASRLGVKARFVRTKNTFDGVVDLVFKKKADLGISSLSDTLGRAQRIRFSISYHQTRQVLFVNRLAISNYRRVNPSDQFNLHDFINRSQIRLGAMRGTSYIDFSTEDYPHASLVPIDHWAQSLRELTKGKLTAILFDEAEAIQMRKDHPDYSLYVQLVVLKDRPDTLAIAVHPEHSQLLSWLNLFIKKRLNTDIARIYQKYRRK